MTADGYSAQKTVSLHRGTRGYGFNLAEEYPCYLSAVHEGGVAWKSGLRTGDRLAAVGSTDVTRTSHKDIVKMIADSGPALQLTVFSSKGQVDAVRRRDRISDSSSSEDCDSDNEIWRRKKLDLAQRFRQKLPQRSRYKNLITPISEALLEDAGSYNGILQKRCHRSVSAFDQLDGQLMEDRSSSNCKKEKFISCGESTVEKTHFGGPVRIHAATVHRPASPPETRHAKRRPLSNLRSDDFLSTCPNVGRPSRSPAKCLKKRANSGNDGQKSFGKRSASAPDYRRALGQLGDCSNDSPIAQVGLIGDQHSTSDEEVDGGHQGANDLSDNEDNDDEDLIKKSVVVYIGAVPIPDGGTSRKNILKSALQSLRAQRVRAHTVLLEIFANQIVITNSKGIMTNRFCADRIAYATSCAENKQYFGVTTVMVGNGRQNRSSRTTTTTDETDESPMYGADLDSYMVCHVFAVDPQLHLHSFHYHYARKFGIHCVRDPQTNLCQEFPYSSNSILHAIGYVYRNHRANNSSTRFSYDSAITGKGTLPTAYVSSNSDSGIGNGRDDFSPSNAPRAGLPPPYSATTARLQPKLGASERISLLGSPLKAANEEISKESSDASEQMGAKKSVRFLEDHCNGPPAIPEETIPRMDSKPEKPKALVRVDEVATLTNVNFVSDSRRNRIMQNSSVIKRPARPPADEGSHCVPKAGASQTRVSALAATPVTVGAEDQSCSEVPSSLAAICSSSSLNASGASPSRSCHHRHELADAVLISRQPGGNVDRFSSRDVAVFSKSIADKEKKDEVQQRRTSIGPLEPNSSALSTRLSAASICKDGGNSGGGPRKPNTHYQAHYQQSDRPVEGRLATPAFDKLLSLKVGATSRLVETFRAVNDRDTTYSLEHLHQCPHSDDQRRHSYHHTDESVKCTNGDKQLATTSNPHSDIFSLGERRKGSHQLFSGCHKLKPQPDSSGGRKFSGTTFSILRRRVGAAGKIVGGSAPKLGGDLNCFLQRLAPHLGGPPEKTVSEQDLLDSTDISILSNSPSKKETRDQVGTRQGEPSNFISCSATDVRQLYHNRSVASKGPLTGSKSVAPSHHQTVSGVGHTTAGSAGEISGGSSKRKFCGSVEQLCGSTVSSGTNVNQSSTRDNYAGSVSSLFTIGDTSSLQQQQVIFEPNPKHGTAAAISTKHGSLLRDRINRRLNRNAGAEHAAGCGKRASSVRMKQALKDRLESWSSDFDRLLRDPAGLYAFSEFLRTQYCQENINFWIACENYKLADENTRALVATELYRSYFASGCMEPVNVDSLARQTIHEAMETENFSNSTFNAAQYQIFHLMKYDCYPRFLKSDEYQRCWDVCEKGQQLQEMKELFLHNVDPTSGSSSSLTSKISTGVEDQQKKTTASSRKSILPWKNKFSGGMNLIGRNKGKKDEEAVTNAQHPSTSASFGVGAVPGEPAPADAGLSSVGSKRKQAWRHTKQLSTPVDAMHAVGKPSSSVEGMRHVSSQPRPNSGLGSSRPPDVVPQPDPPSSPSPGSRPRSAGHLHQHAKTAPGSPSLPRGTDLNPDSCKFSCTLILPSRERVQLAVSEDLTVRRWLHELALRYGLNAAATDIIDVETDEPIDLAMNASRALAGKTVRLEGGVLFKIDLPCSGAAGNCPAPEAIQRKLIAVKARADSAAGQVLRPILNKYGLQLDSMMVCVAGTNEVMPNHSPISLANNKKLMILTQSEFEEWVHRDHDAMGLLNNRSSPSRSSLSPSFEDIVGAKYFQELPSHKGLGIAELPPELETAKASRHHLQHSSQSNGGHKQGGGGMLKFVKKGALDSTSSNASKITGHQTKSLRLASHPHHPLGTQFQQHEPSRKSVLSKQELLEMAREEKKLAELLSRAQASSFDDQRGATVKNFELPDFLKQPTPLTAAVGGTNPSGGAQSSSMDDSIIPSSPGGLNQRATFYHSRPTDLVHRKLCGIGPTLSTASGSCDDDFIAYEPLTEGHGEEDVTLSSDNLAKCLVTVNGEKSDLMLAESRIPTHDEAEALFSGASGDRGAIDFNDPMMTERRRLSDFGLGNCSPLGPPDSALDNTIRSAAIGERSSTASTGSHRGPPPPYQRLRNASRAAVVDSSAAGQVTMNTNIETPVPESSSEQRKSSALSFGDVQTTILDQEQKRKGLYVHHQDDDWQIDYV